MATNQREMWFEVIKSWCKNLFGGVAHTAAPLHIQMALDLLVADAANRTIGVSSKTIQGVVVDSYTEEAFSSQVRSILKNDRRMFYSAADMALL